jgi:hypothetical protein
MAKVGVNLKINVSEIEKARLFKGKKGVYLDATVFIDIDQVDDYGNNGMITQNVSKEEKEQGVKGNILGNCKVFWQDDSAPAQPQAGSYQQQTGGQPQSQGGQPPAEDFDDDIPF